MSEIGFVGMGKLGLPVALAIESRGHTVTGYDIDSRVGAYLKEGELPYTEEGLQPLLDTNNIRFCREIGDVVASSELIFLPIQTPSAPMYEGTTRLPASRSDFDYSFLLAGITEVAKEASERQKKIAMAVISTCLPGTYEREIKPIIECNPYVDYVYTPQFIAMGTVLADYLYPELNLIGVESEEAADQLERFYATINDAPNLRTDITTAEAIKVSYNTFVTMKTVLGNTWGELCHKLGANVDDVFRAWSMSDKRLLSSRYLRAGVGDGGGCHPRDNIALSYIADQVGLSHNIFEDLMGAREDHMEWLAHTAYDLSKEHGLPIIMLGRSFKPETNIETGSPAILASNLLLEHGVQHEHYEDLEDSSQPAVYFIATAHDRFRTVAFPQGSVILDPFRIVEPANGIEVIRIGDTIKPKGKE